MGRQRVEADGYIFGTHTPVVIRTTVGMSVVRGKPEVVLTVEPQPQNGAPSDPPFYATNLSPAEAREVAKWLVETADSVEKNGPATIEMIRKDDER